MALSVNFIGRFMPEDCWIGWDSVVRASVLYLTVWFQRERCEALLVVTTMWHDFSSRGEVS
jgi:hypothetical protein